MSAIDPVKRKRLTVDMNDRFFFAGAMIAITGGCFLSVPVTLVVFGVCIAILGLRGGL